MANTQKHRLAPGDSSDVASKRLCLEKSPSLTTGRLTRSQTKRIDNFLRAADGNHGDTSSIVYNPHHSNDGRDPGIQQGNDGQIQDGMHGNDEQNQSVHGNDRQDSCVKHGSDGQKPSMEKPLPSGQPPVWAQTRSALYESAPYHAMTQSSLSTSENLVRGIFIDKYAGCRDAVHDQVVFYSAGGGKQLDDDGNMATLTSQDATKLRSLSCLQLTMEADKAVVLTTGSRNPVFPCQVPHEFNIMGHFRITEIWPEVKMYKNERITFWKARLEKVNLEEPSWWTPINTVPQAYSHGEYNCTMKTCHLCGHASKHIYTDGWTCLTARCSGFFKFSKKVDVNKLQYNDNFLRERKPSPSSHMMDTLEKIMPDLPSAGDGTIGTEKVFKKGVVCPRCGCCSRRIYWQNWRCENAGCDFTHKVEFKEFSLDDISKETTVAKGKKRNKVQCSEKVQQWKMDIEGYKAFPYLLPGKDGQVAGIVTVLRPTPKICAKPGGPDEMVLNLQKGNIPLKRMAARNANCRNETPMSHFAVNYGAHYKYGVVDVNTHSFKDAEHGIHVAVSQLSWAQSEVLNRLDSKLTSDGIAYSEDSMSLRPQNFNECLCLGYFQDAKIGWHDDGEKELGPTVATLSLGSPSIMSFREKKKGPQVLSFLLNHGDMVIMHGTMIHKLYDHMVEPEGKLRFALTCRFIKLETIPDGAYHQSIAMSILPEGIEKLAYRGIEDVVEEAATEVADMGTDGNQDSNSGELLKVEAVADRFLDPEAFDRELQDAAPLDTWPTPDKLESSLLSMSELIIADETPFSSMSAQQKDRIVGLIFDIGARVSAASRSNSQISH